MGLLTSPSPAPPPICLTSSCRAQGEQLATVLQVPLLLGHLWAKCQPGGTEPTAGLLCPSVHPYQWTDQGVWSTSGTQHLHRVAALLSSFLVERGTQLRPGHWQFARRGKARRSSSLSGLGSSGPGHWRQGPPFLGPFLLSQSPGEARCPGQVTFSRSVARVPGNKS